MKINKNEIENIVHALNNKLVPKRGIEHLMVGRERLLEQFDKDLDLVKSGKSITKFIIGKYGTGKSYTQATLVYKAHNKNIVTSNVDFSPMRRLYNREGLAKALYTEIIKNLKTKTSNKNTLELIIEDWLSILIENMVEEGFEVDFESEDFIVKFKEKAKKEIYSMDSDFGFDDFSRVLILYIEGYINSDEQQQKNAIKWISAEYPNKTSAKRDLGVSNIITDTNYYDFLKVLCQYFVLAGYNGLLVNFDEAVNLYKITNSHSRNTNYEMILKIFNDTIQGEVSNLFITFGGTPTFLEDEFKGLFSYGALERRLRESKFAIGVKDYSQPVIKLEILPLEQQFILLNKIKDIYSMHNDIEIHISKNEISNFLKINHEGLKTNGITIGAIIGNFVDAINSIKNNPDADRNILFGVKKKEKEKENVLKRFGINE